MIRTLATLALLATGCFDSLLGTPCKDGHALRDGRCVVDTSADAGPAPQTDALRLDLPDASLVVTTDAVTTCSADLATDPLNCGTCGRECASGICTAGACAGDPHGHVVAIGHDFDSANVAMLRVLGNAAALGAHHDLAIARWSTPLANVTGALATALAHQIRPWHAVSLSPTPSISALDAADVIVVDPNTADGDDAEAAGVAWRTAFSAFLARGGVVIVLEGAGGTNHRFARGASLFSTSGAPALVTGAHLSVVAPTDAVAQQVASPYLAASSTVAFSDLPAVVATPAGAAVVFHAARP